MTKQALRQRYGHAGHPLQGGWYVSQSGTPGPRHGFRAKTLYGPFLTEDDALRARYFSRPTSERDLYAAKGAIRAYTKTGVEFYETDEIRTVHDAPREYGFASLKVHPAIKLKVDPSWAVHGTEPGSISDDIYLRDQGLK